MLYVYAIVDANACDGSGLRGLEGATLQCFRAGAVAAVYSMTGSAVSPTPENVLLHEQVVERLMGQCDLLPARFGTIFQNEQALRRSLEEQNAKLIAGIERVRGCVELGLRVAWTPPASDTPASRQETGRDYMLARLEEERRRHDIEARAGKLADAIHAPLAAIARESTRRVLATPQLPLSAAYLVSRERTMDFKAMVEALAKTHPNLRLLCTGPWPPYHFVPDAGASESQHG